MFKSSSKKKNKSETSFKEVTSSGFKPFESFLRACAWISQLTGKDLASFCDLATTDEKSLITFKGDYATLLKVGGLQRLASKGEVEAAAEQLRIDLSGVFKEAGHAMQFSYISDPDASAYIQDNINERRTIANALEADFEDIFTERERVLTPYMRQERIWLVLWSRKGCLSKAELSIAHKRQKKASRYLPNLGDAQNPLLGSPELATVHNAFVEHVLKVFSSRGVLLNTLPPKTALKVIREEIYPETAGEDWSPITPSDPPPDVIPETDRPADISAALWPPLREQIFKEDAYTPDFQTIRLGCADWTPVDMTMVSEEVRPFTELTSHLAHYRLPWRVTMHVEGVRPSYMVWKEHVSTLLRFGKNRAVYDALQDIAHRRARREAVVKLRVSFATSATAGDADTLRARASRLEQGINGWGGAQATRQCGDPLEGTMSSVPGIALASTAPPTAAPLDKTLVMAPWARPARPWEYGATLLRAADGRIVPFDPAGSGRDAVLDLFVAPSRRGKSMLANALLLATVLSTATLTDTGVQLPLIGKLDIGDATSGFIDLIVHGLPPEHAHKAIYIPFELKPEHAYNIFDTEACYRRPLAYHLGFLKNFLSLICMPVDKTPFEGMDQIIHAAIEAVYDLYSDGPSGRPKPYRQTENRRLDEELDKLGFPVDRSTTWWDIADFFGKRGDIRLARMATQHAVPVIEELLEAIQEDRIWANYGSNTPTAGNEKGLEIFRRYIISFIGQYPTLNRATQLDLGDARIVALDIHRVAPEGSGNERQTELMYLMGFQIISRNFFLDPEHAKHAPEFVRDIHRKRFREFRESFKRLECDEFQRTIKAPFIRQEFEEAARRAAKLNVKIGLTSQKITDFGEFLTQHSTGRFILGAANPKEATEVSTLLGLSEAATAIVHHGLKGPNKNGTGSPLILQILVNNQMYEMYLLNMLGPIELWALSTNPEDVALRRRVYAALGSGEARRRLARVFPKGTASDEIGRRRNDMIRQGMDAAQAMGGVISQVSKEICDAIGIGALLREAA
ncbi:type IV secretion protein DotO [Acetobacter lambici]|uniref:Type IV secretion protein DotO n=1 Tax=Acetobacter lambici TaxID=1332824 RepID=A0ABT1F172_9PROT|nr:type IV secretion protein DotO [Acetobacter lambici]MCP1242781.1 type IV secretion protein DotO [Acetobacter lambici]MCP1258951.1 type IV secretion protein DotO [Acetobacter lambici]NHO57468.1 type IV secretion protein DotO [Acetobacter lambici]